MRRIDAPLSWLKFLAIGFCCLALIVVSPTKVRANAKNENTPVVLQADKLMYNEAKGLIMAKGNVEIVRGGQILRADKIIYDRNKDVVQAIGHVRLKQPSGEVLFTRKAVLTRDMKEGFIEKVGVLFPDNSRLAAQDAQRYGGRYLIVDYGVYSACSLCADKPDKPPLWQLKAKRITQDNEKHDVIYRDATIEMGGIPILYMPYFSHPDPTVKRRQGFLTPSGGFSQTLGTFGRAPYYIDIAPNSDLVVMPTFSANDKAQLSTTWRHRFAKGKMQWNGSFTHADLVDEFGVDKGYQWRGHLFGNSLFELDNEWRAGTDVALTSDKSYLRRYNITSEDQLINRAYVEGFRGRNYAVANTYYFQDLRPGDRQAEPIVAPEMNLSVLGEPGKTLGGRWSFNAGLLSIMRSQDVAPELQGANTRRLSLDGGWERQLVSSTGFLTNISALTRLDSYWANNVPDPDAPAGSRFSNITKARPFAQGDLTVRYPLGRRGDGYQQLLEPISVFSVAPQMHSSSRVPNEDSLDVEFDETNIFSPNRFAGIDRIEGGTRVGYGLRHTPIGDNGARIEALGGQVYRLQSNSDFPESSGLRRRLSDYVGRIDLSPAPWFDMNYGFRLNSNTLDYERQQLQTSVGTPVFRPFVNYLSVSQAPTSGVPGRVEEITGGFSSKIYNYWSFSLSHRQALKPEPGPRTSTAAINYQDECFQSGLSISQDHTNRQDIKSGLSVLFHFYLKNIGGVHTDSVSNAAFQTPSLAAEQTTPLQNQIQP